MHYFLCIDYRFIAKVYIEISDADRDTKLGVAQRSIISMRLGDAELHTYICTRITDAELDHCEN